MKLAGTMLKLAALAFAALVGSTSAGVMDGPCTISGDMTQVTGNCPGNTQNCLTSVGISPDSLLRQAEPTARVNMSLFAVLRQSNTCLYSHGSHPIMMNVSAPHAR